jgi:hypothetical protein
MDVIRQFNDIKELSKSDLYFTIRKMPHYIAIIMRKKNTQETRIEMLL